MTKSVEDLANIMDVIVDPTRTSVPTKGYISVASKDWTGLRIGTLNPKIWGFDTEDRKPEPAADTQMVTMCNPILVITDSRYTDG